MDQKEYLLNDQQMKKFIRDGYVTVQTDLPVEFHAAVFQQCRRFCGCFSIGSYSWFACCLWTVPFPIPCRFLQKQGHFFFLYFPDYSSSRGSGSSLSGALPGIGASGLKDRIDPALHTDGHADCGLGHAGSVQHDPLRT